MMRRSTGIGMSALYVGLALVPLLTVLVPPRPLARDFWIELSLAAGFIGLAQLGLQFALIARFERISRPFGIDLVMQYHRQIGVITALLVLAHPVILVIRRPAYLSILNPLSGNSASRAGVISVLALLLLIVFSFWRKQLRIGYETWRVSHALLAIVSVVLAQLHVSLVGIYVNTPWKHGVLIAWSALLIALIVYLRLIKPIQMGRRAWEVVEIRPEPARTWMLALAPVDHAGMRFAPGQFAWLKVGVSPWSIEEHPFSFSSSAERTDRIEFGIKELGDFTSGIGQIPIGTRAFLDGPHGSFSIDFQPAGGYLFIAGGIGISPILSMLKTLADRHDERSHVLVYACSRWDRIAFREEIDTIAEALPLRVVYVLEEAHESWTGPTGFISREVLEPLVSNAVADDLHVFVCGPDAMLSLVEQTLLAIGLPEERINMERFNVV
jgi:predicted ferric reductase